MILDFSQEHNAKKRNEISLSFDYTKQKLTTQNKCNGQQKLDIDHFSNK